MDREKVERMINLYNDLEAHGINGVIEGRSEGLRDVFSEEEIDKLRQAINLLYQAENKIMTLVEEAFENLA